MEYLVLVRAAELVGIMYAIPLPGCSILANQADNAGKVVDVSLRDIEIPVGGVIGGAEYFVPLVVDAFKHYAIVRINDMRLSPLDE